MNAAASPEGRPRRRITLLGSTGSIGQSTLDVVRNLGGGVEVVGLAAGRSAEKLAAQAADHPGARLALAEESEAPTLRHHLAESPDGRLLLGPDAAERLVETTEADLLIAAMVGAAGLGPALLGIRRGMDIALANKETLVAAGELVVPLAREHGVRLLPVDSEHSAIFQCLRTAGRGEPGGPAEDNRSIKRIVLTASGGPFRTKSLEEIRNATVDEALNHPTWAMGPKITIDSATMMNKALEIIEAHWLFGLPADRIDVIIHPQSIAHSFVEFNDHSILAQLGPPDMKTPIQYALSWPDRAPGCGEAMDWTQLSRLDFEQPDFQRFPALGLAYRVIEEGGTAGAVLNAANEQAVEAFLDRRIPFGRIVELAEAALDALPAEPIHELETVLEADRRARAFVREQIGS
jgi:1-deoxy-D-xylulose-5-phosphate reductoisomerase